MADRRAFLLRVDPALLEALQVWANDDLRSLNGQIEFLLRRALKEAGRERPSAPSRRGELVDPRPSEEPNVPESEDPGRRWSRGPEGGE